MTESPGWTGFVDNEGSLLVSRRAGVIGDLEQGLFFQSPLPCWVIFHSFLFLKNKNKNFYLHFFGGVAFIPGLFLFLEFLPGYLFSPV